MGVLSKTYQFFAERLSREPRYAERRIPYAGRTTAGVYITADNALQVAAVWACCRYLSQTVAQLPWRVMRMSDGKRELADTHRVDYLLHTRPNPEWSPFQFKETLIHWAVRHGNGYAEIELDQLGRPYALWPIHPTRVCPMRDTGTGALYYEVKGANAGDETVDLDANRMFHIRGFGEGPVGVNVMEYAAESIGWARAVQLFGSAFFGNGMNLAGAVLTKSALTKEGKARLEAELDAKFKGPKKSNKWFIGDAGMDLKALQIEPDKGQFVQTAQHLIEEIARWFGVPPHKIQHLLRSTFTNIEQQSIEVVQDAIAPWAVRLEEEANFKLFGQNRAGFYTKINLRGLLRGDFKSQQEGFEIMRRNAALSADEWRDLLDMDPLPDGMGGDKYITQAQNTTLEMIGEAPPEPQPVPDAQPTPQEQAALNAIIEMMKEPAHV